MPTSSSRVMLTPRNDRSSCRSAPDTRPTARADADDIGPERESQHRTQAQAWKQDATFRRDGQAVDGGRSESARRTRARRSDRCCRLRCSISPGADGPSRRTQSISSARERGAARIAIGELPRTRRRRAAGSTAKRRTSTPRTRSAPSPYSFFHVRGSRAQVVSTSTSWRSTELLGEQPAGVLGAGRDLAAVARRDERKLHAIAPRRCGATSGPRSDRRPDPTAARQRPAPRGEAHAAVGPASLAAAPSGAAAGSTESGANMSRYFRSITGQL